MLILCAKPNECKKYPLWWKHSKSSSRKHTCLHTLTSGKMKSQGNMIQCEHNARLNALKSSELNKCINPSRGQSISIFFWVQALGELKKLLVCAKTKIGGGRTKKLCAVLVLAGETQASTSCSLTCKPNRDRPTLECFKWWKMPSRGVK